MYEGPLAGPGVAIQWGEWNFAIGSPIPSKPTIFIVKAIQRILKTEKHLHSSLTAAAFSVFHPVCCILLGHTVL